MSSNRLGFQSAVNDKEAMHDTGEVGDHVKEDVPGCDNEEDEDALFDPSMFDWGLEPSTGANGENTKRQSSYSFPVIPVFLAEGSGSSTPRSGEDSLKSKQSNADEAKSKSVKDDEDKNIVQSSSYANVKAEVTESGVILPDALTRIADDLSNMKSFPAQQSVTHQPLSLASYCSTLPHPFAIQSSAICPALNIAHQFSSEHMDRAACFPLTGTNVAQVSDIQQHALAAYLLSQPHFLSLSASAPLNEQSASQEMPKTSVDSSVSQPELANKISAGTRSSSMDASKLPPFLLFGAPIELRENFMQAQRLHGIRPLNDNNSVHYGMVAANGLSAQAVGGGSMASSTFLDASGLRLIDGRHGDVGSKRMRNAREQKRSQKINDLIDQLRDKMEHSGWRVGLKSKFHTLSSCAEFIKHLIKLNKEKESSLRKAKEDFQARQRKNNLEKYSRQEPSDPESTASSLTVSSSSKHMNHVRIAGDHVNGEKPVQEQFSTLDSNDSLENQKKTKKAQLETRESSLSSVTSSGVNDEVNNSRKLDDSMISVAVDQHAGSSVSDITDSNKGHLARKSCEPNSSVTSDAAVARGFDKQPGSQDHSDVVIKVRKRKHISTECVSLTSQSTFSLDYERVFLKSNIPQILAATSGRIVAYNDFFLKATGLTVAEVERLTIFGLIRSDKLSNMFEIVASALRSATKESKQNEDLNEVCKNKESLSTVTMPCTKFRSLPIGENGALVERQMYLTVMLMPEEDPQKRYFHCILTDRPGVDGKIGPVTPELLSVFFQKRAKLGTSFSASISNRAPPKKRKKRSINIPQN